MPQKVGTPDSPSALSDSMVRAQLDRILASEIFSRSERLSAFLKFIVEQTLQGQAGSLKEQVLGEELYNKGSDFDGAADPVVRVDARRLRDKLREYYVQCGRDPVIISLPKGTYVPVFERNSVGPALMQSPRWQRYIPLVAGVLLALFGLGLWALRRTSPPLELKREILTAYPGLEEYPTLSPDGSLVAFSWSDSKDRPPDIWIKAVRSDSLRRLTETPDAEEIWPAWSPDGDQIAFHRSHRGVFIVSPLGGPERKVSDHTGIFPAWAPKGKSILVVDAPEEGPYGISEIDLDTLRKRRITQPSSGIGEWKFAVSPDGTMVAFSRSIQAGFGALHVVPMAGGDPRRLTDWGEPPGSIAWTPDGKEIIYGLHSELWRIPAQGRSPGKGTRISIPNVGAIGHHTLSRPGIGQPVRLVFESRYLDVSLRLVDLDASPSGGMLTAVRTLADSTIIDWPGRFSPGGSRLAFVSTRTGNGQKSLWTVGIDDSQLRHLQAADSQDLNLGSWSPDGQEIVFDASNKGNFDVYVIRDDGTRLRRLTNESSMDQLPWWSRDGRWVYFTSDRTGRDEIWRVAIDGGPARQITRNGGYEAMESPDGRYIYHLEKGPPDARWVSKLLRTPVESGDSEFVVDNLRRGLWQVTESGILFLKLVSRPSAPLFINLYQWWRNPLVAFCPFGSRSVREIGRLPFEIGFPDGRGIIRMAASPNGRWLLTHTTERIDSDLMFVPDFRLR